MRRDEAAQYRTWYSRSVGAVTYTCAPQLPCRFGPPPAAARSHASHPGSSTYHLVSVLDAVALQQRDCTGLGMGQCVQGLIAYQAREVHV
eukprot:3061076-Rhodomonas_salina.1